jgi:KDO2-lipid IV(A) lauroyltransferase
MSRLRWLSTLKPVVTRYPGLFYRVSTLTGLGMWLLRKDIRENVTRNQLVLWDGDRKRARRQGIRVCKHVSQYYVDLSQVSRLKLASFERDHLELDHPERLRAIEEPGPVIALSAHMGNAEFAIQALTARGRTFAALVERQEPPEWSRFILELRSAAGGKFYEAGFHGLRACLEALQQGQVVGLMGDRDIQGTGIAVTFFGRRVKLPRGPWELARRTNALVLPVFSSRKHHGDFRIYIEEAFRVSHTTNAEADVREAAERFAVLLEKQLRRDPGQWTVLEDFWTVHGCGQG